MSSRVLLRRSLLLSVMTATFVLAGCASGATSSAAPGAAVSSFAPEASGTPAATSPDAISISAAAAAYLPFVTAWNAKLDIVTGQFNAAGSDQVGLGKAWTAFAGLSDDFATGLAAMSWPSSVQPTIMQFITDERADATAESTLAGAPFNGSMQSHQQASDARVSADAAKLRQLLGLPQLAATATPTPTPAGPTDFNVGDLITISQGGVPTGTITVNKVVTASSYGTAPFAQLPQTPGDIYLAVNVKYVALADGFNYNPFDWQVFVDGSATSGQAFVLDGPKPELGSGSLPSGRNASGWIVYEVGPTGQVVMSYSSQFSIGNAAPPFEIILRGR